MRILAVTADASLITALTSMMLDWEIVHVREPEDAKPKSEGAGVVLVDSGTTDKGIETAKTVWNHGVTLPCLVIGDVEPSSGTRVRVLVRPFSLQDLTAAVDEVAGAVPVDPSLTEVRAPVVDDAIEDLAEEAAAEVFEEPRIEPEPEPLIEAEPEPSIEPETVAVAFEPEPPSVPQAPPGPVEAPRTAEAAPRVAESARGLQPQRPVAKPEAGRRRFQRRREAPAAKKEVAEDPMIARLRQATDAARELEALVHELPVLAQPRAMAHAFLGEVVEMFAPQVAAVFAPSFDGSYGVIAAHGLSSVEVGMKVSSDQPLFLEIAQTLQAVLIAPVDLAQGLVAGIGGARTEALIAAPMAVGRICHAIVIVGRQDFTEFDLDLLAEQADEAAPGLALAQMIDRIRGL